MRKKYEIEKLRAKRISKELSSRIIDELGGTSALAAFCCVRPQSVSDWRRVGIPRPWALYFRERFKTLPIMREAEILDF